MIQSLNGEWKLYKVDGSCEVTAKVPTSVYATLFQNELMEDPYYRLNEKKSYEISKEDFVFDYSFVVDEEIMNSEKIILRFNGVDTVSEIFLNSEFIGTTENMHRTYEFDVTKNIQFRANNVKVIIKSPLNYIAEKNAETKLWGVDTTVEGFSHMRKAHYMFGWDWGPKLPDMGIWRDVELVGINKGRFLDVYVNQDHRANGVGVTIETTVENLGSEPLHIEAFMTSPDGQRFDMRAVVKDSKQRLDCFIEDPLLWEVRGYGRQHLYMLTIVLFDGATMLDKQELNVGLRTIKLLRQPDDYGESFCFVVNGKKVFAMGANYIPEDNIISRTNFAKTKQILLDCVAANFNMVRVWGGGYYPDNYFYEICDQLGLLVWQDFMFACAVYNADDTNFCNNIRFEIADNVKRIRNHACLALWCGNNETETGLLNWNIPNAESYKSGYLRMFERLIPSVLRKYDPKTEYWPSSPSSGGSFDESGCEHRGDTHFWSVWHGFKDISEFKKHYFRFLSEYGMGSIPSIKTMRTIAEKEDLNLMSRVVEGHHKCVDGNQKLMYYIAGETHYPMNFENLIYASQLVQANGVRTAVEFMRQNREICNGSLYWQLGDSNPAISWSSIDYFGRWKALHYYAKRFYAPIICTIDDSDKNNLVIHLSNETPNEFSGIVKWKIRKNDTEVLAEGESSVNCKEFSSTKASEINIIATGISEDMYSECYVEYSLLNRNAIISSSTYLFCKPKHFNFLKPNISFNIDQIGEMYRIKISSKNFAYGVFLDFSEYDAVFSDNWFDLHGNEKSILVSKNSFPPNIFIGDLNNYLQIKSYYDLSSDF